MLAAFACVAFADGVGRRPPQKQANPRENPHPLKSKGAAPANPREGGATGKAGTLKKNAGDSFGGKSGG
jgi:hypothetical protein